MGHSILTLKIMSQITEEDYQHTVEVLVILVFSETDLPFSYFL